MKKLLSLLLVLMLLCAASTALAATGYPGDTVSVSLSVTGNPNGAVGASVGFSFDSSVLEFVSASSSAYVAPGNSSASFQLTNLGGIPTGTIGSVTFRIKPSAAPGTYPVRARVNSAYDADDNNVSLSVSGGSVVVEKKVCSTHSWDSGKVTKPTCVTDGSTLYTCTVCGETKTDILPATGHTSDGGKVTKQPTCTAAGEKVFTCTACGDVIKTEAVPVLGHTSDGGKITKQPTCTAAGEKTFTCTTCGDVIKTEAVPALGHTNSWIETTPVTDQQDGEEQLTCSVCGHVSQTRPIPSVKNYRRIACSIGPRFRDVTDLTEEWDMFTPIDLSVDGEQSFDLIAGNAHKIGVVKVTVAEGQVTISYELANSGIAVTEEFLTLLPDLASVTAFDLTAMTPYAFNAPISIEDDLAGDTKVLMYMHNTVTYTSKTRNITTFANNSEEYLALVESMQAIMD